MMKVMNKIEEALNDYQRISPSGYENDLSYEAQQELYFIKLHWNEYKEFLMKKYPAKDGEDWEFTCEYHQRLDELINGKKS